MGNVFNLDGAEVSQNAPCRNPRIAHVLEELYALNDKGMLDCVVVGAVRIDGAPMTYGTAPTVSNIATLIGAVELAKKFYTDDLQLVARDNDFTPPPKEGA